MIYRRQSLREQKDKVVLWMMNHPRRFLDFLNDALEKEYHRQLEVEEIASKSSHVTKGAVIRRTYLTVEIHFESKTR